MPQFEKNPICGSSAIYGAPNSPKIKYLSWLHFIWLNDFTRHKYCLSWVNTDTKLGRWHKTRSMTQNSAMGQKLSRSHKTRSITQISVDGTKLDRWHKTRPWDKNSVDHTKLGRSRKSRSMAQNSVQTQISVDGTKTRSITQNPVDGTKTRSMAVATTTTSISFYESSNMKIYPNIINHPLTCSFRDVH